MEIDIINKLKISLFALAIIVMIPFCTRIDLYASEYPVSTTFSINGIYSDGEYTFNVENKSNNVVNVIVRKYINNTKCIQWTMSGDKYFLIL